VPGESVRFNECMCLYAGVVVPMTDAIGLGKMQGQSSVKGTRGAGAQDLVKLRIHVEAVKNLVSQATLLARFFVGRLSIARHQRFNLVDCVCVEERVGDEVKNTQFHDGILLLTQRHAYQRISQQIHPLLVAPLHHRQVAETKARRTFDREKSVRFSEVACPLEVPCGLLCLADNAQVVGDTAHHLALVPETLNPAQDFDAPCLQPNDRGGVVFAAG